MNLSIPVEKLRQYKIMVATPMYGGMCTGAFTKSCLDLSRACAQFGVELGFNFIFNESLIQRARNYLVDEFLRSDANRLIFIDADIEFRADDVLMLAALDKDIIGAPYPKKCIAWERIVDAVSVGAHGDNPTNLGHFVGDYVFNLVPGQDGFVIHRPVKVLELGTGFLMISREALMKWQAAYPEKTYLPDHNRSEHFDGRREIGLFFDCYVDETTRRYLSEDYSFCQMARKAGMDIWMAPWMPLKHAGTYIFEGSLQAIANLNQKVQEHRDPKGAQITKLIEQGMNASLTRQQKRAIDRELEKLGVTPEQRAAVETRFRRLLDNSDSVPENTENTEQKMVDVDENSATVEESPATHPDVSVPTTDSLDAAMA